MTFYQKKKIEYCKSMFIYFLSLFFLESFMLTKEITFSLEISVQTYICSKQMR